MESVGHKYQDYDAETNFHSIQGGFSSISAGEKPIWICVILLDEWLYLEREERLDQGKPHLSAYRSQIYKAIVSSLSLLASLD